MPEHDLGAQSIEMATPKRLPRWGPFFYPRCQIARRLYFGGACCSTAGGFQNCRCSVCATRAMLPSPISSRE